MICLPQHIDINRIGTNYGTVSNEKECTEKCAQHDAAYKEKCTPTIKTRKKCTSNIVTTTLDDYQKDSTGKQYLMCTKDSDCNGGTCVSPIDQPTLTTEEQDMMDNYCNVKLSCAEAASKTLQRRCQGTLHQRQRQRNQVQRKHQCLLGPKEQQMLQSVRISRSL